MNFALVFLKILANALPIAFMLLLIGLVENDYVLALIYIALIAFLFRLYKKEYDLQIFLLGCIVMFFSEWVMIQTGTLTFQRLSLFGLMPIWLPILWGYAFVAIKRASVFFTRS